MKVLLVTMYFPPAGGGGVQRPLKFATHLPEPRDRDARARARRPEVDPPRRRAAAADARVGAPRALPRAEGPQAGRGAARHAGPRAARVCTRGSRAGGCSCPTRTSLEPDRDPGGDPHRQARGHRRRDHDLAAVVGAPRRRGRQARDRACRGSPTCATRSSPIRTVDAERMLVRAKEQGEHAVARLVARNADAIVTVSDAIAEELRARNPTGAVETIANGSDFDDFAGLEYRQSDTFRITHAGSFFGKRDPRPFLTALARAGSTTSSRASSATSASTDREWAEHASLGDRLELIPYAPRRRSLELQRDSEALLLLIPDAGGRGKGVLSGKVFEYLAAERPILAVVPPDGAAAELIRDGGRRRRRRAGRRRRHRRRAPRPARAVARGNARPRRRSRTSGGAKVSRRTRVEELARLLERSRMRRADQLPVSRERLLRHVREGALERRGHRLARRRARDCSSSSRSRSTTARLARAAHDRGPARLLRARSCSSTSPATSTSPTRTRSRSGGRA